MIKAFVRKQLNKRGYDIIKLKKELQWASDFESEHRSIIEKVEPFTMTSRERIFGLIEAVKYVVKNNIEGDIVECGVWKGGSMLTIADVLKKINDTNRDLYLYDTFEGMSKPSEHDLNFGDQKAEELLASNENKEENFVWAYSTLDTVKETMSLTAYPQNKIHYIKGKVEETIPARLPGNISLLRLDTDWYESTKHELIHLFPKLVRGGVLIIDDYGFWKGARKAVDEYIAENKIPILLNRLDETGRIAVKLN
jgi:O-methyltransferase